MAPLLLTLHTEASLVVSLHPAFLFKWTLD
jgi:hypothetical protein